MIFNIMISQNKSKDEYLLSVRKSHARNIASYTAFWTLPRFVENSEDFNVKLTKKYNK